MLSVHFGLYVLAYNDTLSLLLYGKKKIKTGWIFREDFVVGQADGTPVGRADGAPVGRADGTPVSRADGTPVSRVDGTPRKRKTHLTTLISLILTHE